MPSRREIVRETILNIRPASLALAEKLKRSPHYFENWPNRFTRDELERFDPVINEYIKSVSPFEDGLKTANDCVNGTWRLNFLGKNPNNTAISEKSRDSTS